MHNRFLELIARHAPPPATDWLRGNLERSQSEFRRAAWLGAYASVSRRFGNASVELSAAEREALSGGTKLLPSWDSLDQLTRCVMLLTALQTLPAAEHVELLSSNFLLAAAPPGADFAALRVSTPRGSRRMRVNDTDTAIDYLGSWKVERQYGNYDDDTQHVAHDDDASFRYRFEETGIDFITTFDSDRGEIAVYLDDELRETGSCFAPSRFTQTTCARISGLQHGSHVLEIKKRGGQQLSLDALQVYEH